MLKPYAHRTERLANQQRRLAFDAGGEAGARLLRALGTPVSHDTLLRLVRNAPEKETNTPRVLGIDDWAKRKGQSYGTILVDLEAHKPVDLLADRSAELVAEWLRTQPTKYPYRIIMFAGGNSDCNRSATSPLWSDVPVDSHY